MTRPRGLVAALCANVFLIAPAIAETAQPPKLLQLATSDTQRCRADCVVAHEDCVADVKSSANKGKWPELIGDCDARQASCKAKCR